MSLFPTPTISMRGRSSTFALAHSIAAAASLALASTALAAEPAPSPITVPPQGPGTPEDHQVPPLPAFDWGNDPGEPDPADRRIAVFEPETGAELIVDGAREPGDLPDDPRYEPDSLYPPFDPPPGAVAKSPSALVAEPNTSAFPWRTIVQLRISNGTDRWSCTGETVGPFQILTAAHCLYGHQWLVGYSGWATEVIAYPGQTDVLAPTGVPEFPYGEARGILFRIDARWQVVPNPGSDWGMITLDRRAGDRVGWMARSSTVGSSIHYAGYPKEGPYSSLNQVIQHGYDAGNVTLALADTTYFSGNVYGGMSGGPSWRVAAGPIDFLVGNHSGKALGVAADSKLTNAKRQDLNDWIASDTTYIPPVDRAEVFPDGPINAYPSTIVRGHDLDVDVALVNMGYVHSGAITVRFYLRGQFPPTPAGTYLIGTRTLAGLGPMQRYQWTESMPISPTLPSGHYDFGWEIDATASEYDTTNNDGWLLARTISLESCVDADQDGYGTISSNTCPIHYQVDCDDANPAVHPGAPEIPGNGIDDNCNGTQQCGVVPAIPGASELGRAMAFAAPLLVLVPGGMFMRGRMRRMR
ncbi:MAG: trypsin-like serine protease [Myxococcales bacterium]|nr:trypsin-like serine protease [Myxococcales bacterium]